MQSVFGNHEINMISSGKLENKREKLKVSGGLFHWASRQKINWYQNLRQ